MSNGANNKRESRASLFTGACYLVNFNNLYIQLTTYIYSLIYIQLTTLYSLRYAL